MRDLEGRSRRWRGELRQFATDRIEDLNGDERKMSQESKESEV